MSECTVKVHLTGVLGPSTVTQHVIQAADEPMFYDDLVRIIKSEGGVVIFPVDRLVKFETTYPPPTLTPDTE